MRIKTTLIAAGIALAALPACQQQEEDLSGTFTEAGSALVVNEGNFTRNNGSVSYIDRFGKVVNNVYETINGTVLGDVVQSYSRTARYGIICVNNSQKVEIVDARTFKHVVTLTAGTTYPRYSLPVSEDKVYVSNGNATGQLLVVDLERLAIVKTIGVGAGPEELVKAGSKIYVANSGGFYTDNTVSVIDPVTDTELSRITVGDNPTDLELDAAGHIWVLCKGYVSYDPPTYAPKRNSAAKLVHINTASNTVDRQIELIGAGNDWSAADNLETGGNGNILYFSIDDKVYQMPASATTVPALPLFTRFIYGLEINPATNDIWALDAGSFSSSGYVFRYSATGSAIDSMKVGIGPNFIYFN